MCQHHNFSSCGILRTAYLKSKVCCDSGVFICIAVYYFHMPLCIMPALFMYSAGSTEMLIPVYHLHMLEDCNHLVGFEVPAMVNTMR
jgi:hypothetical protein